MFPKLPGLHCGSLSYTRRWHVAQSQQRQTAERSSYATHQQIQCVVFQKFLFYYFNQDTCSPRSQDLILILYTLWRLSAVLNACLSRRETSNVLKFPILQPVLHGLNGGQTSSQLEMQLWYTECLFTSMEKCFWRYLLLVIFWFFTVSKHFLWANFTGDVAIPII
jgi:hypothetical protein